MLKFEKLLLEAHEIWDNYKIYREYSDKYVSGVNNLSGYLLFQSEIIISKQKWVKIFSDFKKVTLRTSIKNKKIVLKKFLDKHFKFQSCAPICQFLLQQSLLKRIKRIKQAC